MKCNCESTHCNHEPSLCTGEGKIKFDYVGLVCLKCADVIPKEYLLEIPVGTLLLFNNRFGIVREVRGMNWLCEGITTTFSERNFAILPTDLGEVHFDIEMKTLYEFEESIGENVYDSFAQARNCLVLETTKNSSGRAGEFPRPEYWVKAYDPDSNSLVWLNVDRYSDGHLRWSKP